MEPIPLNLAFEDQVSEFVMMKMVEKTNKYYVSFSYSGGGFGYLKTHIKGWNQGAKGCPFFVLTDLDEFECPPYLLKKWLNTKAHPNLILRVAVKEVESWLLADIEGFSEYTGISKIHFQENVETINDPKKYLFRLIRKCRIRNIKEDILPKDDFARIGPNYNDRLCEFVANFWNIDRAVERSESLKRAMNQLINFEMN